MTLEELTIAAIIGIAIFIISYISITAVADKHARDFIGQKYMVEGKDVVNKNTGERIKCFDTQGADAICKNLNRSWRNGHDTD